MERFLIKKLIEWKENTKRKPLILNGARQVGKTWLLKYFGNHHFEKMAYISLDNDKIAKLIFENDFNTSRIISNLSIHTGVDIEPENTLIVLDEIQAAPKAITSLKYFCENASEYAICAAGSLLGLSAHAGSGYPVGKVHSLDLYPLNFEEFLDATGNTALRELLNSNDFTQILIFKEKLVELLKSYYVVGGMPEVVSAYIENENYANVREIQRKILEGYERDFSKHIPSRLFARTLEVWQSIPSHLSQENKKFVFGHIRHGARSKDYEEVLTWLESAGLIYKVPRVTKPNLPLDAYNDNKSFKVFLLDVGVLGAMSNVDPAIIIDGCDIFTEFKGALAEQYVCQLLKSCTGKSPFYWSAENSIGEIDFLVQNSTGQIYAIEVKAEENLKSKSLRAFKNKYQNIHAIRFSLSNFREQDWMTNIPLYAINSGCKL